MTKEQARIQAKAVAYAIAAALGMNAAQEIMREAATAIQDEQWRNG
jgi:hypothetical protein